MRVTSSSVQLSSSHLLERVSARRESLELWVGARPPAERAPAAPTPAAAPGSAPAAQTAPHGETGQDEERLSARDALDLAILRKIFGLERDLARGARDVRAAYQTSPAPTAQGGAPATAEGWGLRYDREETTAVHEAAAFTAQVQVTTADGRSVSAQAALSLERLQVEHRSVHVAAGDAARQLDPLVVNLGGAPATLSGRTAFDLDGDGRAEQVAQLDGGSAYLALDRNGNGRVDSGRELLGPTTGSGFGELAALDADGNGWVDEADPAFDALRLWNQATGALQPLRAAGVGALYTRSAATPFTVTDVAGAPQAAVGATGIFLREDGGAGTLQHLDLVV